jgi:hypothetical protein
LVARFSQGRDADKVSVKCVHDGEETLLDVKPLPPYEIPEAWYV